MTHSPTGPDRRPDHESDPSLDEGTSSDWTDEGGATPDGPATDDEPDRPS